MNLSDYRILVTDNDAEAASRVSGVLSSRGMQVERISRLPGIESIPGAEEIVTLVIITGGVHEQSTLRFLEGIKHAPASLGVICLVEPTEPERLSYFDSLGVDEVFEPRETNGYGTPTDEQVKRELEQEKIYRENAKREFTK